MKVIHCEQGTAEWFRVRSGIPTASRFDKIVTAKTGKLSAQAIGYICELIAERATGVPVGVEAYTTRAMQDGIDTEPEARNWYALETGDDVRQVGFCLSDDETMGCSPDGLVGDDGGLELKCPLPKTHVAYLLSGTLPDEYRAQVHGSLLVTGRRWWDFVSYCHGFPPLKLRVTPDAFTELLAKAVHDFVSDYAAARLRFEQLGGSWMKPEPVTEPEEVTPF